LIRNSPFSAEAPVPVPTYDGHLDLEGCLKAQLGSHFGRYAGSNTDPLVRGREEVVAPEAAVGVRDAAAGPVQLTPGPLSVLESAGSRRRSQSMWIYLKDSLALSLSIIGTYFSFCGVA
jgi:hypothetical protein